MEGLIILFVIIGAIQKIVEKIQEARKGKNPAEVRTPEPQGQRSQTEAASSDPFDIFRDWEKIFFPQEPETVAKDTDHADDQWFEEPYTEQQPVNVYTPPTSMPDSINTASQQNIRPQFQRAMQQAGSNSKAVGAFAAESHSIASHEIGSQQKLQVNREAVRQGILWSEILTAPRSSLHWRKHQGGSSRG